MNIKIIVCQIIGPAAAVFAGPVPTPPSPAAPEGTVPLCAPPWLRHWHGGLAGNDDNSDVEPDISNVDAPLLTCSANKTSDRLIGRIGVNATGDTSPAMFGQPGTKYLISPAKFVRFLLSHAKRHCVEPMNTARCFD